MPKKMSASELYHAGKINRTEYERRLGRRGKTTKPRHSKVQRETAEKNKLREEIRAAKNKIAVNKRILGQKFR